MEFVSGGELFDYIADRQGLDEAKGRQIFSQIALAIQHCHQVMFIIIAWCVLIMNTLLYPL